MDDGVLSAIIRGAATILAAIIMALSQLKLNSNKRTKRKKEEVKK